MTTTNTHNKRRNPWQRLQAWLDKTQQSRPVLSFPHAVIKKYSDDNAGHQAALITYYGFLSLFPLLLVATSVIDLAAQHNADLRDRLLAQINTYFPIVGDQLQANIHNNKTGIALVIGLLVTVYGTRGIADAIRGSIDHAWAVPHARRSGFPKTVLKSFGLLLGAGLGLLFTTTLAGYATAMFGHAFWVRVVSLVFNIGLLYLLFVYVFLTGASQKRSRADVRLGAIVAACGIIILQIVGVQLIKHELHNLRGLYGQFALVLAILFWIYLQAQVFIYALEITVVSKLKLWPRGFGGQSLTPADRTAYRMYAQKQAYLPKNQEEISVTFREWN